MYTYTLSLFWIFKECKNALILNDYFLLFDLTLRKVLIIIKKNRELNFFFTIESEQVPVNNVVNISDMLINFYKWVRWKTERTFETDDVAHTRLVRFILIHTFYLKCNTNFFRDLVFRREIRLDNTCAVTSNIRKTRKLMMLFKIVPLYNIIANRTWILSTVREINFNIVVRVLCCVFLVRINIDYCDARDEFAPKIFFARNERLRFIII